MNKVEGARSLPDRSREAPQRPPDAIAIVSRGQGDRASIIHASIHGAILEHRLLPGTKLPEDQIGAIFGTSRTLVRAALQSLARDGMIVQTRNRSASVASPTPREARELFEARRVIEAAIVRVAVVRANASDLVGLRSIMREGREALAAGDRGRAIRLSGGFHLAIARVADQTVLAGVLEDLVARSSLVIALYGHSGRSDCGDADHDGLLDAFDRQDPDLAETRMIEHLQHIEADLELDRGSVKPVSLARIFAIDVRERDRSDETQSGRSAQR